MNAADLTAAHIGQHAVIRIGTAKTKDRVAGAITHVNHNADGTSVTVAIGHGWQTCCLSHDDPIELKEDTP